MIRKFLIFCLFALVTSASLFAESDHKIKVVAHDKPLNEVLLQLREQYDFQFSYSDNELSSYRITVSRTFNSKDEALKFLLNGLPFQLKKSGDVFIIIPDKKLKDEPAKEHIQITGQIVEAGTFEPLPYSAILINNQPMIADVTGNFNFTAKADSALHVRISHLGYYIYDTLIYAGLNKKFKLVPATLNLPEVLVENSPVEKATIVGEKPGKISINHNIARFLPGQGDNSVFNLIRLMPGIQAAGEQSNDLLIWGSYEGQSLITFDEFTLFGLKNYNDNISVVNPFLVKNIEILKGGFSSKYGNRIGGIINLTGKNGNMRKPVLSLNINPTTVNGMLEIPLFRKSSLLLAYRQTYYNLYNPNDFNIFAPTRSVTQVGHSTQQRSISFDMNVFPNDYQFRDMNLKYSYNFDNDDQFYVSAYGGGDYFKMDSNADIVRTVSTGKSPNTRTTQINVGILSKEENRQLGFSTFYHKKWSNTLTTKFIVTYSDFSKTVTDSVQSQDSETADYYNQDQNRTTNTINEGSLRLENTLNLLNGHQFEFGAGFYTNQAEIGTRSVVSGSQTVNTVEPYTNNRLFTYVQDYLPITGKLIFTSGIRVNFPLENGSPVIEPRLSSTFKISNSLKINAAWGLYRQFIFKIPTIDAGQNYTYLWITANQNVPVLKATHWIGEINYFKHDFTLNLQAYFKPVHDMTERIFGQTANSYATYFGDAKSYGLDVFAKKDFGKQSVWASYNLNRSLERFAPAGQSLPAYTLAPQDQRHELKVAGLFNLWHFYLSANYVYGSGMEIIRKVFPDAADISYNRVDAAVTWKFNAKHASGELGLSVLNVFDTKNLRYANLKIFRLASDLGDFRIYSSSVPFTPILFLKLVI